MANGYFVVHNGLTVGNANIASSGAITTTGNINGCVFVAGSTLGATSTSTGALRVAGGAGVAGNVYTDALYTTTGLYWAGNAQLIRGGPTSTTSSTAPGGATVNDIWYDTSTDTIYRYTFDGTNTYWVDINGPTFGYLGANTATAYASNLAVPGTSTLGSVISGNIIPAANVTYDLGTPSLRWRELYLSGNTIHLGGARITTDTGTGAIAMVPIPTLSNPNPKGLVIDSTGGISQIATTAGQFTASALSSVITAAQSAGSNFANITVATSASVGRLVTTNGVFWANGTAYSSGTGGGTTLPSQSGNNGKYLTTNGSTLSWATVSGGGTTLPANTNAPGVLINNGSGTLSWNLNPYVNLSNYSVVLGWQAGGAGDAGTSVAIGQYAGSMGQGISAVAVGAGAGYMSQSINAVALGPSAGFMNQGTNAIAIGANAGAQNQPTNTIILNATSNNLNGVSGQTDSFYVDPIRQDSSPGTILYYNPTTKEVSYGAAPSGGSSSGGGSVSSADQFKLLMGPTGVPFNSQNVSFTGPVGTGKVLGRISAYPFNTLNVSSMVSPFSQLQGPYAGAPGPTGTSYPWASMNSGSSMPIDAMFDNWNNDSSIMGAQLYVLNSSTDTSSMTCWYCNVAGNSSDGAIWIYNGPQQAYGSYVSQPNYVYGMISGMGGPPVDFTNFQPAPGVALYYDATLGLAAFNAPGSIWGNGGSLGTLPGYSGSYMISGFFFGM